MSAVSISVVRVAVVSCVLLSVVQTGSAFIIDNFYAPTKEEVTVNSGTPTATGVYTPGTGVLGLERSMSLAYTSGSLDINAVINAGVPLLTYSEGAGTIGSMLVMWDGVGTWDQSGTDGMNQSFNVRGQNELAVGVSGYGDHNLSLQVWDGDSSFVVTKAVSLSGGNQRVVFDYSEFGVGIDWGSIQAVQMGWITTSVLGGTTANFQWFETQKDGQRESEVPEPGTMALMAGLFGMGLVGAVRRRLAGAKQPTAA